MNENHIEKVMKLFAKHKATEQLLWHSNLDLWVLCNDVFFWACADGEGIGPEDYDLLEKCFEDLVGHDAIEWLSVLYACRKREMRPQGAMFRYIKNPAVKQLMMDAGPERETGFGNPRGIQ